MSNITGKKYTLGELPQVLDEILDGFLKETFEVRQRAVRAGAEVFKKAIESATPKDTGKMAQSWVVQEYLGKCYVGNKCLAKGKVYRKTKSGKKGEARSNVPLSNVLEYGEKSPHYGFIRRTFDEVEPQIYAAIERTIKNGGN